MKKTADEKRHDNEMGTDYHHRKWEDGKTTIQINQDDDGKYHAKISNDSGEVSTINQDKEGLLSFLFKHHKK